MEGISTGSQGKRGGRQQPGNTLQLLRFPMHTPSKVGLRMANEGTTGAASSFSPSAASSSPPPRAAIARQADSSAIDLDASPAAS